MEAVMAQNRLMDQILVVDIESTCWRNNAEKKRQVSEVIEIGIVPIHVKTATVMAAEKRSIMVRPVNSEVSEFCTELTGITQEQASKGTSFIEACNTLYHDFNSSRRVWGSWGDYDRHMIESQCSSFRIKYPFGGRHINIKTLFAIIYNLDNEIGMMEALELTKLAHEGKHHRGVDDAYNIARIFSDMLKQSRITCVK